jgi:starch-binding outer membrane protein, SusD/RagB family
MKNLRKYKKLIIRGSFLGLILVNATSCKKNLLTPDIISSIPDVASFDTPERILAQVNGLYAAMKSGSFYGGRLIIYNELRADDFIMNKPNVVTGQQTWLQSVNPGTSEVSSLWTAAYLTINRVNIFLAGLEANKSKVSATLYNSYGAEARFLRALTYFALVQTYAQPYTKNNGTSPGLPLRLIPEFTSENSLLARSTVAQVYAQILSDLDAAETNLPLNYGTGTTLAILSLNTTRASRNTAIALKTRVYLAMNNYNAVIASAEKIVSPTAPYSAPTGVPNRMDVSIGTVFSGNYVGPEAVFSLPFTPLETPGGQNQLAYYFGGNPGNQEYYLNPAGIISDPAFGDISNDARKGFVMNIGGQKWLSKFKVGSTFSDNVPVIRYPEVLLNYAEALVRAGGVTNMPKAISLLQAVRSRSNAGYVFAPASIATPDALIETILKEKRIEFFGEGFRVPDLQRLQLALPGKISPSNPSPTVAPTEGRYIWPLPSSETSINTVAEQNPS